MAKQIAALTFAAGLLAFAPWQASAQTSEVVAGEVPARAVAALPKRAATMSVIPLSDALNRAFRPLYDARPDGPTLLVLEGDTKSGPSLTLFRYGRDYAGSGNLHFHTHDYHLWVIEGALKHWDETSSEDAAPVLLPGSYVYQPADLLHAANCLSVRCTAYIIFDGPIETGFPTDR